MKSLDVKISLAGMTSFLLVAASLLGSSSVIPTVTATTVTATPPVTTATDNESVNVLINWEPTEIEPEQDTEFTLDFQDPSSGDSIPHVNYNFEIIDENNGETVESMTDLHTHSGSDEQTVTFDTTGSFNFVVTVIGTGINPPFDTTQSGTAETIIAVGQEEESSPVAPDDNGTEAATDDDTTTTTTTPSSGLELSPNPIYQERIRTTSETPINQTHLSITYSGNGTLTLPNNTTETINTTSNGSALISFMTLSGQGKETFRTEDGDNATVTFFEPAQFNPATGEGKGVVVAVVHTNSTDMLAPLNGTIVVGIDDIQPNGESFITLWEWESGIQDSDNVPPIQGDSPMNMTTATTNATATDTNAATTSAPEE